MTEIAPQAPTSPVDRFARGMRETLDRVRAVELEVNRKVAAVDLDWVEVDATTITFLPDDTAVLVLSTGSVNAAVPVDGPDGTAGSPTFGFESDPGNGV